MTKYTKSLYKTHTIKDISCYLPRESILLNGHDYTKDELFDTFNDALENPLLLNQYSYLISTDNETDVIHAAGFKFEKAFNNINKNVYWYNVARDHKIEDLKIQDYSDTYQINCLIVYGIFPKTNINNIDKVRQLYYDYYNIPKIFLISGGFGPKIFNEIVNLKYDFFIHFLGKYNGPAI